MQTARKGYKLILKKVAEKAHQEAVDRLKADIKQARENAKTTERGPR
jgi:hypothetical protein